MKSGNRLSRREVLAKGAWVASVLALPQFLVRKAWGQTAAFDFYISTTGSDSNPGTLAAPWALTSLLDNNANNSKIAGKRIGLIAGTYSLGTMASGNHRGDYTCPILHLPAGSSSANTYCGSSNASGQYQQGVAIIQGNGTNTSVNSMIGQDTGGMGYFTIDGLVLDGLSTGASDTTGWVGSVIAYCVPNASAGPITLQNCEFRNLTNYTGGGNNNLQLVFQSYAKNSTITNCYFHGVWASGLGSSTTHSHCYEEDQCVGTTLTYCTFMNCEETIDLKLQDAGINFSYNYLGPTFNGCGLRGFDEPGLASAPNVIHHNVFDGVGYARANDVEATIQQSITFYNNTIYDSRTSAVTSLDLKCSGTAKAIAYNNIICKPAGGGAGNAGCYELGSGQWTISDYNYFAYGSLANGWGYYSPSYSTLAAWQAAAGNPDPHSIVGGSANFVGVAGNIVSGNGPVQFQLAAGSPCIGAGRVGGTSAGVACDLGAWANGTTQIGCSFSIPSSPTTLKAS
jgi:hypothetical protein